MTALINLSALFIIGMAMASHEWITATYNKLPLRIKYTLHILTGLILVLVVCINLQGPW